MKTALHVVGGILGALAVVALVWAGAYALGVLGNKTQASYNKRVVTSKIQQNVNTATFAQAVYERFFDECNHVVALNDQIAQAKERLAETKGLPDDLTKSQQVGAAITDLTGVRSLQTRVAADYNAQSEQWTRGAFKDANLPQRLVAPYDNIVCG